MAKSLKLKAVRVHDLYTVFNSLTPADIAKYAGSDTMKSIRGVSKLVDELEEADKGYMEVAKKIEDAVEVVRKDYQEKLKSLGKDDKEAEDTLLKEANEKAKKTLDDARKEYGMDEAQDVEVEVVINSDDRYTLLKTLFEKTAPEKYLSTPACAETWEAIESAKEI